MTKQRTAPTDTISFRADRKLVLAVKDAAKKEGVSLGEYILAQIDPESELGRIISMVMADTVIDRDNLRHKAVQSTMNEILSNQPTMRAAFVDFITGLTELKEQSDKEGKNFKEVFENSILSISEKKTP